MSGEEQSAVRYQFTDTVDVLATFDMLGIEHLEVSAERTIVIYSRTIFDFEVNDGRLEDARTVTVEVSISRLTSMQRPTQPRLLRP